MTRLAFGAFGANSVEADGFTLSGVPTVVASPFTGGGPYAMEAVGTATAVYALYTAGIVGNIGYYVRTRFRTSGSPAVDTYVMSVGQPTTTNAASMGLAILAGTLSLRLYGNNAVRGTTGVTLLANTDYLIELFVEYNIGGGANETITGRVDGVQFDTVTASIAGTVPPTFGLGLSANAGITVHYTDWAINNDQGADNNTWCGDARTTLLLPVSDDGANSFIGADGWRAGNSATTNLWDAVNNTPPTGAASPGTTASQIVCDTPSTTRLYVAISATYDSVLAAGDTLNCVQGLAATGESIATGTKAGPVDLFANPVGAGTTNFNFGNDVGADGTFPTNWYVIRTAVEVAPSVTRSSGVKLRIGEGTNTRSADVCFMGVYVDYTPAVAAYAPPPRPIVQRIPHVMR